MFFLFFLNYVIQARRVLYTTSNFKFTAIPFYRKKEEKKRI